MASSALTCISSVLGYLQTFLENLHPDQEHELGFTRVWLRSIETFLFCARKWGNDDDASLGALIDRINDYIYKTELVTHTICPTSQEHGLPKNQLEVLPTVSEEVLDIELLCQGINDWYLALSDCSLRHSSNPPFKKDELVGFIDSLLESLDFCFLFTGFLSEDDLQKSIEALKEKLKFLKNFIHFVTMHGVEDGQLGPLFDHTEFVTANAARLSFTWKADPYSTSNHITDLLEEIIPTESQAHETCVQALITSKFSRHPYRDSDERVLRDFLEYLPCNIWSILKSCTFRMISFKFQLQLLWERFRSLRTTLKDNPNKFDEKMRDLTGLLLCDAGLLLFSLSLNATDDGFIREMDIVSLDLLERINLIKLPVAEECLETSPFNFPRTNALGFIDFLLKYMTDMTSSEASLATSANHTIQTIRKDLDFLRSFLGKIVEMRNGDEELQEVWDRVVEVAYTVEFLIDSVLVGDTLDFCSLSFDSTVEEIETIKAEVLEISDTKRLDVKEKEVTKSRISTLGSTPINNDVVVGFEDEATSIINRLTRGSRQVQIVPIVGMPGLGKTTLAKKIYNDPSIMSYFYRRAWCTASQVYVTRNLLLEILTCIESKLSEKMLEMSEEDLAAEVKKRLLRTRYLIVLDDVWDMEVWNRLEASFPSDGNGSRVIMTSRLRDVVPQDNLHQQPHYLRQLTHDESWNLLKEKLCPGKDLLPPGLCELQTQIMEICQGLPLTIVILAGILANMDQSGWTEVVQSLSSRNISSIDQCTTALELSYEHLPDNLKPCFLYFGGFPEDYEYTTKRLIWLWVAEGFAQATDLKSAEDVANDYMMDLINRSLIMVSKQRSIGGVKTCRIHDLLHEFCVKKAKEENFLELVRGYDELYTLNVPRCLRRLCINSTRKDFNESWLAFPTVRSLLFFAQERCVTRPAFDLSFNFHLFKLLRVLDLSQINIEDFPREIELLVHLRYLAVLGHGYIQSSIANLQNLETFIADSRSLPDTIWNLKKLRHLVWKCEFSDGGFDLPTENLDDSPQLCNLDTLSGAILFSWENRDKIFKKFPNVRKLKCKLILPHHPAKEWSDKILALDFSSRLESLNLSAPTGFGKPYPVEFHFSLTIRKLTLSGFCLPWSKISAAANLPNLEVLKLLEEAFVGETWDLEEEEFPELRFLKLASLDIVKWTAFECENSFPRLQKLVLDNCYNLEEIPSSLGNVFTLGTIEVSDCPNSATSVNEIQEEQISMGNNGFKVITSSKRSS